MENICKLLRTCESCSSMPGCQWGILFKEAGRCVSDFLELGENVLGVALTSEDCGQPQCKETLVRNVEKIDWAIVGGISGALSLVFGAIGVGIFYLLQRKYFPNLIRPINVEDIGRVAAYIPPINMYMRRNTVRAWARDVFNQEADQQDRELAVEVMRLIGVGGAAAVDANDVIDQLQQQQQQQQQRHERRAQPPPIPPEQQHRHHHQPIIIPQEGNVLLDPHNIFDEQQERDAAAILNLGDDDDGAAGVGGAGGVGAGQIPEVIELDDFEPNINVPGPQPGVAGHRDARLPVRRNLPRQAKTAAFAKIHEWV